MRRFGEENDPQRAEWVEKVLKELPAGLRILDAGAGEQRYRPFCSHLRYVAQDFARYDGTGDKTGMQMGTWKTSGHDIVSDLISIPEPDASFDVILCTEVLEHVVKPIEGLKEFTRLLKPRGGILILTAPFCSMTHMAPYHFYSGFNRFFYSEILKELGFEIVELTASGNYFQYLAQEILRCMHTMRQYNAGEMSWLENKAKAVFLKMLERCGKNNDTSSELLCYGYHVRARKI